jgi:predicted amidohydrolase YtcJ
MADDQEMQGPEYTGGLARQWPAMLLTNGRIYTLDARDTIADTLVVRDGRVAFAGRRAEVNANVDGTNGAG